MLTMEVEGRAYTEGEWYRSIINGNFYKVVPSENPYRGVLSLSEVKTPGNQMEILPEANRVIVPVPSFPSDREIDYTNSDTIATSIGLATHERILTYKGCVAHLWFDMDKAIIVGYTYITPTVMLNFTGKDAETVLKAFINKVEDYLEHEGAAKEN